jgi:hypothetical protein
MTEAAERAGGAARSYCWRSCSYGVGLLDFHRKGGTKDFDFFLQGIDDEAEATEQRALRTADQLLAATSPEQLAAQYLEVVFEETYCGMDWRVGEGGIVDEAHPRGLNGLGGNLNCTPGGWKMYTEAEDKWHEAEKNYLLCRLDGKLPTLPSEPPAVAPRKNAKIRRMVSLKGFTTSFPPPLLVAKDGSVISQGAPVEVYIPAQGG